MAVITTSPYQVALFLRRHIEALPPHVGVSIFTNTADPYAGLVTDLQMHHVPLSRAPYITPADAKAWYALHMKLQQQEISSVVTMSPKAGFIGQLAASTAGIDRRVHIFTGQVWESMPNGATRTAVLSADRAVGRLATHLSADSPTQAASLVRWGVAPRGRMVAVPHDTGSIRGVDLAIFKPDPRRRATLRDEYRMDAHTTAFVHLGRIAPAKGIPELVAAFARARRSWRRGNLLREPRLFLVGQDEGGLTGHLWSADGIHIVPFVNRPNELLGAMDVMVLASHREGFGSAIIEGAALGLPAIGTDIVGLRDAIVAGETGWLVPPRSESALYEAIEFAVQNHDEVLRRGIAARLRAHTQFDSRLVTKNWVQYLLDFHEGEVLP